ncbi:MAG: hypothetical protein VW644_04460, partial [Alphaproteobacteria bacterium]
VIFLIALLTGWATVPAPKAHVLVVDKTQTENIYITNLAPHDWSDAAVKHDIPAWQTALNRDFAHYWHTTHYKLVFLGRKPAPAAPFG